MEEDIYQVIEASKTDAGRALAAAFATLSLVPYSEQDLAKQWLVSLRQYSGFYAPGWYDPPPDGVIACFGDVADGYQRLRQPSFRPPDMWPSTRAYKTDDILAVYASPLHRLNLMGDFGLSLYGGDDAQIHAHFESVLKATLLIARNTKVGMAFNEVYAMAMEIAALGGFTNDIESSTDLAGTNIGHTIPLSYRGDPTHDAIKGHKSFIEIKKILSDGRKFINAHEHQVIEENMAFTVEPRLSTASMPNTWFHLTLIFEGGRKRICHGFGPVLQQFRMMRLLKVLEEECADGASKAPAARTEI